MTVDFEAIKDRIEAILLDFVATRTDSDSMHELNVGRFFSAWAEGVPYLRENPKNWGLFPIPEDILGRTVPWCLLKGRGARTVVMIHHCDCVETSNYGALEPLCLDPAALEAAFRSGAMALPEDASADLDDGGWLFGRGVCDMKGGASVQLALFEQYSREIDFEGNVLILSVPDEENLSAGMRGALYLLAQLKAAHGLQYAMMLNCEPHQREEAPDRGILYDGSIGKVLPMVYVRGRLAHVGQVFDGFNPIGLLGEIVSRTEVNPFFIEKVGNTVCPPCTWLYAKDQKQVYDVSLPQAAVGCLSVLPLKTTPLEIMAELHSICEAAFAAALVRMNDSHAAFCRKAERPVEALSWTPCVRTFSAVYADALADGGDAFRAAWAEATQRARDGLRDKSLTTIAAVTLLIETTLRFRRDTQPMVVLALAPPYYPSANNGMLPLEVSAAADAALAELVTFGASLGVRYDIQNYFVQISDLSYAMLAAADDDIACIEGNMPLWGSGYDIPLALIREMSMPVCNVGPWGKDLHRYTERVNRHDLLEITPRMVDFMAQRSLRG